MGDEKLAESRCLESGGEKEARRRKLRWGIALNDIERVILEKNGEKEKQIEGICDC